MDPAYEMELAQLYDQLEQGAKDEANGLKKIITQGLWVWFVLICAAVTTPVILMTTISPLEDPATWFQRSGSIVVVLALLSELRVQELQRLARVGEHQYLCVYIYIQRIYRQRVQLAKIIAFIVVVIGTIIWGYGDLIYEGANAR